MGILKIIWILLLLSFVLLALFPFKVSSTTTSLIATATATTTLEGVVAVPKVVPVVWDRQKVMSFIEEEAIRQGVNVHLALYIAKHESRFEAHQTGDMNLICKRTGKPVRARGIFQITECYYPNVSDAEAYNAEQNIKIGIGIIAKGKAHCIQQFSTCRRYYSAIME